MRKFVDLAGYEGLYMINKAGEIWSIRRNMFLKPNIDSGGYHMVRLYEKNAKKHRYRLIHHLVLETFIGPRPEPKMMCRHLNDVKSDNRLCNLKWGTRSENTKDSIKNGNYVNHSRKRMNSMQVALLRKMRNEQGMPLAQVAAHFKIKKSTVSSIANYRRYKD